MRADSPGSAAPGTLSPPTGGPGRPPEPSRTWHSYYNFPLTWYAHLRNVLHHLPLLAAVWRRRPCRIIEVGSGTGSLAIALSYRCRDVVSVDVDTQIVHRCREANSRLLGHARFLQGDGFHLEEFTDGEFAVAFSQGLLEHFSDREILALLSEQLRVARLAVFSVPNNAYERRDFGDERLMSGEQWEQLLSSLDLRVLERRDYRPFTERLWREPKSMTLIVVGGPRTADR